jgi:RimJ/RimL family protein N-acetyltransferase
VTLELRGNGLILRNWGQGDRELFHEINSDPEVMRFFPFRRTRAQSDQLMDRLAAMIEETGLGFMALEIAETGECAGFAGLAKMTPASAFPENTVEIGWRLARRHWGKGLATKGARLALAHGFEAQRLDEIVSFAVQDNYRSLAVMKRLGMRPDPARDFDHPSVPDDFPHLKRHRVFSISGPDWMTRQRA